MTRAWLATARPEIVGGLVSAAVAIPLAMGYGMFAFVALGDAYFAHGILAGLYTAVAAAAVIVVLGDRTTTVYAPRVVTTFFLGSLVYGLAHSEADIIRSGNVAQTLAIVFSIILLGGVFQALFGVLRLGTLIKHTPHPVMAGFQNAAALLLFLVQIGTVLGYDTHTPLGQLAAKLGTAKPLSVLVALVTILTMWHARRFTTAIPPLIVGLVAGTATYYTLSAFGWSARLGPVIGSTPAAKLQPSNVPAFAELVRDPRLLELLPTMVSGALGLAIIASIDALLCAQLLRRPGESSPGGNAQLIRLGLGNTVAAACSGITSGINLGPSLTNQAYGARRPLSVLVNAGAVLLTLAALLPIVAYLPRVALSGVIMVVAIQHVDRSTIHLVRRLASRHVVDRWSLGLDLLVILLVATLSIVLNIVVAVLLGIVIAIVLFLRRMSRSLVRRTYCCDTIHSRRVRDPRQRQILNERGRQIQVLELEGALFFGTAERLTTVIDAAVGGGARFIILDLGRVTDVDSTGGRVLLQIHDDLTARGGQLLISSLNEAAHWGRTLRNLGVTTTVAHDRPFQDIDRAIDWSEEQLLLAAGVATAIKSEFLFEELDLFRGLGESERATLRALLTLRHYQAGDVVIQEGAGGAELFIVVLGSASVYLQRHDGDRDAPRQLLGRYGVRRAGPSGSRATLSQRGRGRRARLLRPRRHGIPGAEGAPP